ncbi:MAG TPA: DMT family transporter [Caldimonas sp.]|jgi:drug/metabolite transporter (DMT)-like permease|nr:DMT family transporter [Caldimonas sp.]
MERLRTWQLFAICVVVWGTTWHAITYQLAGFPAALGVAVRFALAGAGALVVARWRGDRLAFSAADHGALALQGMFLYGLAYVAVYQAERFVPSGLVAVGYSASPLVSGIGAALLFGAPFGRRFATGGLCGVGGVALMFWPEIQRHDNADDAWRGAGFTGVAVLLSAIGSLVASRNRTRGMPLLPAIAYGMLYGAVAAALVGAALGDGRGLALPTTASWWLSLVYLAFAGSVLAFACFLTLQDRVGVGRAGTVGVMTPLLALVVSLFFEGFRPTALTLAGALLAGAGNALMLRPGRSGRRPATAAAREAG